MDANADEPDSLERKTISLPRSMWRQIDVFQHNERIATLSESMRRVVHSFFKAEKRENTKNG